MFCLLHFGQELHLFFFLKKQEESKRAIQISAKVVFNILFIV